MSASTWTPIIGWENWNIFATSATAHSLCITWLNATNTSLCGTLPLMMALLAECGFVDVTETGSGESADPELAREDVGRALESLHLEGRKPFEA